VSVNGPAVVLVLTRLGLRGSSLRDSLAAALLGLSLLATPVVLVASGSSRALPDGWVVLACVPALLIGHRFGAAVFRRLDDDSHHRVALAAAAIAGLLSIGAALA
jgi:peptidoglycan/LPS O-acetylase OafA/YrhL